MVDTVLAMVNTFWSPHPVVGSDLHSARRLNPPPPSLENAEVRKRESTCASLSGELRASAPEGEIEWRVKPSVAP